MSSSALTTALLKKRFIQECSKHNYSITKTCEALGIARITFYDWKKADPRFRKAYNNLIDEQKSLLEEKLYEISIEAEDHNAIKSMMAVLDKKRKGKDEVLKLIAMVDRQLESYEKQLGLTPMSRLALVRPVEEDNEDDSPFANL